MIKRVFSIAVIAACVLLYMVPAFCQEDITSLLDPAFPKHQRPAAVFAHDAHNEMAGIEDCAVCHHVWEDGKIVEDESSEDQKCSDCHAVKAEAGKTDLRNAYHQLCSNCHVKEDKGPISCAGCHPKGGAAPAAH
ncbi:acidic tetraheme cytochrome c3 TmcA [Maridesulfovibrio salexigens]|uniref:Acidic cytochrome c3 n=1 Tax=Maridesulfovibrio salexigens (strain ATCC 14822 / DSM 2638 / NCIMB 8403 / VKM B-1763) TaxID=526222 RepID=C6C0Z5_MARSD|nr:cytochrome c3 family protein [Maridesulfovibrio salexigens]ACS81092.1 acidic cytochrome c3 [Maridesulfovibrio salexigens DSM 2638]